MEPNPQFLFKQPKVWAYIKLISELLGYSENNTDNLKRFRTNEIISKLDGRGLSTKELFEDSPTELAGNITDYLNFRADILEQVARPNLMNRNQARVEFERLRKALNPQCPLPMNKQKGSKRHYAFLTGIVNMLTEKTLGNSVFDSNPRSLITISRDGKPVRTLSRWMDGAYPNINNPIAVWEIKEYYGTTTFGSRVADGVYETMLDGLELSELREHEEIDVKHYLIVDDAFTWWKKGKSYLCRIVDMLHMNLVDEVLFGRETLLRWPKIVKSWQQRRKS